MLAAFSVRQSQASASGRSPHPPRDRSHSQTVEETDRDRRVQAMEKLMVKVMEKVLEKVKEKVTVLLVTVMVMLQVAQKSQS